MKSVPFPLVEGNGYYEFEYRRNREKSWGASDALGKNLDLKGVLTPPMKEDAKKDQKMWFLTATHKGIPAQYERIGVQHGFANFYTRLIWALGYGADPDHTHRLSHRPFSVNTYKIRYLTVKNKWTEESRLQDLRKIDVEESKKVTYRTLTHLLNIDEESAKQFQRILPQLIKASIILGDIVNKYAEDIGKSPYDAFVEIAKHPNPHALLRRYASKEEIAELDKWHRILYNLVPEIFEKESGVEHHLPPQIREKNKQEVMRLLFEEMEEEIKKEEGVRGGTAIQKWPTQKSVQQKSATGPRNPKEIPWDELWQRREKYNNTDIEVVREGDNIIVLPHKHPKEIPRLVGPDPTKSLANFAASEIAFAINRNGKKPEEVPRDIEELAERLSLVRKLAEQGKTPEEIYQEVSKLPELERGHTARTMWNLILLYLKKDHKKIPNYSPDHLAAEYRAGEIAVREIAAFVRELLENPEKYGIDIRNIDTEKLKEILREKIGYKIHGFHHERR